MKASTSSSTDGQHPFDRDFPKSEGPPPIANYTGKDALEARDPEYTVFLDAGAFRAVWELLEAEARLRYPTRQTMASSRAYVRGVEAFRRAYHHRNELRAEAKERMATKPVRQVPRRVKK